MIHLALDAGVNLIDTADVYSGGEGETRGTRWSDPASRTFGSAGYGTSFRDGAVALSGAVDRKLHVGSSPGEL